MFFIISDAELILSSILRHLVSFVPLQFFVSTQFFFYWEVQTGVVGLLRHANSLSQKRLRTTFLVVKK